LFTTYAKNVATYEAGKGKYVYMIKAMYKDLGESPYSVAKELVVE
jgi:hypothetical protein